MTGCEVDQPVYLCEWIAIFETCLVEVSEVDGHPPSPNGFPNQDDIWCPFGALALPYEPYFQKLWNLTVTATLLSAPQVPSFLNVQLLAGIHPQLVFHYLRGYS